MLRESIAQGLLVDAGRLTEVRNHGRPAAANPWAELAHESLNAKWKIAEYYPKRRRTKDGKTTYRLNKGRARTIRDGARIDQSALRRVRAGNYLPRNFPERFIDKIKSLQDVPDSLPFDSNGDQ
jgi:hypothetical protein